MNGVSVIILLASKINLIVLKVYKQQNILNVFVLYSVAACSNFTMHTAKKNIPVVTEIHSCDLL